MACQGFIQRFTNENVDQRDAIDGVLGILEGDREVFERQSRGEGERTSERREEEEGELYDGARGCVRVAAVDEEIDRGERLRSGERVNRRVSLINNIE